MDWLRRNWFLTAYLAVLAWSLACPGPGASGGALRLDLLKTWCIAGIFLCAGLGLPARRLGEAFGSWRAHLLVQALCFLAGPLLALAIAWLAARAGAPPGVQAGLLIVGCLPTTIGSCVAVTGLAKGNQGIALINSVLGNLLGLVATPLLVLLLLGREGSAPVLRVVGQLALVAALPVAIGQVARLRAGEALDRRKPLLGIVSGTLLLVVILGIFSDLAKGGIGAGASLVVAACVALHLGLYTAAWVAANRFPRPDRIAIAITASQKTAALGIPLIHLLFAGDTELATMLMPVAIYHMVQLVAGSLAASKLSR